MIITKRIYDYDDEDEYYKIFVDRLWPRGISKSRANWNEWLKEIAPSSELRKWFAHEAEKWPEFKKRYKTELESRTEELKRIKELEKDHETVVLLYAAKDSLHNNAIVIKEYLTTNMA